LKQLPDGFLLVSPIYDRDHYCSCLRHFLQAQGISWDRVVVLCGYSNTKTAMRQRFPKAAHFISVEAFLRQHFVSSKEVFATLRDFQSEFAANQELFAWSRKLEADLFMQLLYLRFVEEALNELYGSGKCVGFASPNEHVFPHSYFHIQATRAGLESHYINHGAPTSYYWPSFSKYVHTWDQTAVNCLAKFGYAPEGLRILGNPEVLDLKAQRPEKLVKAAKGLRSSLNQAGCKNLLFFSQLQGNKIWQIPWFHKCVEVLVHALQHPELSQWTVRFRFHPNDTRAERDLVKDLFLPMHERFSPDTLGLVPSIALADACLSASSSALAVSAHFGRPSAFLWHPTLEELHGGRFIGSLEALSTSSDILHFLKQHEDA
jgi:hypothetical protein